MNKANDMNSLERFHATVRRQPIDRPAAWLGMPDPRSLPMLFRHFGVDSVKALKLKLKDDIWPVEFPYHSPVGDAIYEAFGFAVEKRGERTLTAKGFFEGRTDPACVGEFDWPNPADFISPEECRRAVAEAPEGYAVMGIVWSAHFQDACSAFGMESSLMTMLAEPEMYIAVIDRIVDFYLKANEIFYEATRGLLHAVLLGNDFGTQRGLIVSPDCLRRFILPGIKQLVQQAKSYGLTVLYHSCGSIHPIIGDLIEAGVDVIHPIQALAADMDAHRLKDDFNGRVSFCGGVDAQQLLVNGKPEEVEAKVLELVGIFPTGLIVSPSHEAILPDIPPANIEAMFRALSS